MAASLKSRAVKALIHFADAIVIGDRRARNDFEYGIRMAKRASSSPPQCVCTPCMEGDEAKCEYEYDIGFQIDEGEPLERVFDLRDGGRKPDDAPPADKEMG